MAVDPGTVMAISGAASAALGVGGNIIQNRGSAGSQKRSYNYQRLLNEQQAELNEKLYKQQFDYEAAYNTPLAQMQRYQAAGINPFVATSQGIGQAETSVGAPSVSNGQAPGMYTPSNVFGGIPQAYSQMAAAFYDMSKTKGQDIENEYQRQSFEDRLKALGLQIENQEVQNSLAKLQQYCDMLYKIPQAKALLDKTQQEVANLILSGKNIEQDTLLKTMEKEYYDALGKLTGKQKELLEEQFPYLVTQAKETANLIIEQKNTEKSKQRLNDASAQNQRAQGSYYVSLAETENRMRDFKVAVESYLADKNEYEAKNAQKDYELFVRTFETRVENASINNQAILATIDLTMEQYEKLIKENKWYEASQLIQNSSKAIDALSKFK